LKRKKCPTIELLRQRIAVRRATAPPNNSLERFAA
jgi:hypothetical protein